jgi:hypothetical protein
MNRLAPFRLDLSWWRYSSTAAQARLPIPFGLSMSIGVVVPVVADLLFSGGGANLLSSRRVVSMLRWSVIRHGHRSKLVDCAVARCSSGQAVGEEVGVKRIDGFEEFAARLLGANPGNPASDGTSD